MNADALIGGVSGAIVGSQSDQAWQGFLIGAATGFAAGTGAGFFGAAAAEMGITGVAATGISAYGGAQAAFLTNLFYQGVLTDNVSIGQAALAAGFGALNGFGTAAELGLAGDVGIGLVYQPVDIGLNYSFGSSLGVPTNSPNLGVDLDLSAPAGDSSGGDSSE